MRTRRPTSAWVLLGAALVLVLSPVLAGCGSASPTPSGDADVVGSAPTVIPAASGAVTTRVPVTILAEEGKGPELCLGGIAASLPPQCGGPKITGFVWADHPGTFEEVHGTRWGEYVVKGRFDGSTFAASSVIPASEYDGPAPVDDLDLSTPCPEPAGGWKVTDPATTDEQSMSDTFEAATKLPDYASSWIDPTRSPTYGSPTESDVDDPKYFILNVQVTEDVERAEALVRRTWGGAFCVTRAEHTDQELRDITEEIEFPGTLGSSSGFDHVDIEVIYDDGSLQRWADATYDKGLVRVSSALAPASG